MNLQLVKYLKIKRKFLYPKIVLGRNPSPAQPGYLPLASRVAQLA
jgi:hypothetical protein